MGVTPERRRLIAAVHAAAKAHGLDEETYRDKIELVVGAGTRSASACSDAELRRVLDAINGAKSPSAYRAESPTARKARALWISAYNLGLIADASEGALRAWVARQNGVDDLAWVRPSKADAVITALKQMAKQRAGVDWSAYPDPRLCVLAAQWRLLVAAGEAPAESLDALISDISAETLNRLLADLGRRIRARTR
ncbi:Mu-like prophage protein gp16 [uncultured Alphaproteobacteria bacterium]|uniref:Mu-like prophage protein gp16 n=1 Tax=uncultured Alphaproteobacteria bacterium TaxID=91750 RepID=A0A212KC87_9PROT|nr:Mu-like prophage protein gp16 [uncultured Alphaproteobacteria bacterium]